jgi:FkbM family methyltransferase
MSENKVCDFGCESFADCKGVCKVLETVDAVIEDKRKENIVKIKYKGKSFDIECFPKFDDGTEEFRTQQLKKSGTFWEIESLQHFETRQREPGVYLDCGANIGNHSIFFSEFCKTTHVYAIEPFTRAYEILQRNVRKYKKITTINVAVSDYEHESEIFQHGQHNYGENSLYKRYFDQKPLETVSITTIDNIVRKYKIENITAIKLDIEGNEPQALLGAIRTIEKNKPLIYTEVNSEADYKNVRIIMDSLSYAQGLRAGRHCFWYSL